MLLAGYLLLSGDGAGLSPITYIQGGVDIALESQEPSSVLTQIEYSLSTSEFNIEQANETIEVLIDTEVSKLDISIDEEN